MIIYNGANIIMARDYIKKDMIRVIGKKPNGSTSYPLLFSIPAHGPFLKVLPLC